MKRHPMRSQPTRTGAEKKKWQQLRADVFIRDGGACVPCGDPLDPLWWECHHRLFLGRGGCDELCNLIATHPSCHLRRIHNASRYAETRGWAISQYDQRDPSEIPVRYADGSTVFLFNDLQEVA